MTAQPNQSGKKTKMSVTDLSLAFGGLTVLHDVSVDIFDGELLALIGPNGAGKTSFINCISGFYHPTAGDITFGDHDLSLSFFSPHQVRRCQPAKRGGAEPQKKSRLPVGVPLGGAESSRG